MFFRFSYLSVDVVLSVRVRLTCRCPTYLKIILAGFSFLTDFGG